MDTLITILIPVTFLAMFAFERVFPARPLPKVQRWVLKGFVFFVITGILNAVVPALAAALVAGHVHPLGLSSHGLVAGTAAVILATEAVGYFLHRAFHRWAFLWRWTHQLHHSAERVDIPGAVYFHPFDIALQTGLPAAVVALLGVTPDAAALGGYILFVLAMFQHMNVRTPHWLGYLILRPEQHSVHHARGVHAYNYGNFALMDLLFGTFRNPASFTAANGFWDGASSLVGSMLLGRDVGEPGSVVRSGVSSPAE
jgi:sterol desaturase/sphingolipid hydroxylase (fatty acid hydroxylase superfamily)